MSIFLRSQFVKAFCSGIHCIPFADSLFSISEPSSDAAADSHKKAKKAKRSDEEKEKKKRKKEKKKKKEKEKEEKTDKSKFSNVKWQIFKWL